jgi:hypothetical protein
MLVQGCIRGGGTVSKWDARNTCLFEVGEAIDRMECNGQVLWLAVRQAQP